MISNLATLLICASIAAGQFPAARRAGDTDPCPGGGGTAILDVVGAGAGFDWVIRVSDLIVVGTVVNVLPGFSPNPAHLSAVETDSLIAVDQIAYGTLPSGSTVLLMQIGGTAGQCTLLVPDDPLVKNGERYIFFLRADDRKQIPNTSGSPRYFAVGYWSGKAKVVDGKIQFLPSASKDLHKYDDMDASEFIQIVQETISKLRPSGSRR
jgi:hypothetical protein